MQKLKNQKLGNRNAEAVRGRQATGNADSTSNITDIKNQYYPTERNRPTDAKLVA